MNCEVNACKAAEKKANRWALAFMVRLLLICGGLCFIAYKLTS